LSKAVLLDGELQNRIQAQVKRANQIKSKGGRRGLHTSQTRGSGAGDRGNIANVKTLVRKKRSGIRPEKEKTNRD